MILISVMLLICISSVQSLRLSRPRNEKQDKIKQDEPPKSMLMMETEITSNYIDSGLFDNWFHYAKPFLNSSMYLVFDARDEESKKYLSNFNFEGIRYGFLDDLFGDVPSSALRSAGTNQFKDTTKRRPKNLQAILDKGYVAMHYDLDTVWAKNPFAIFNSVGTHDLLVPPDNGFAACTCLLYLQPSEASKSFLTRWIDEITDADAHDQVAANRILRQPENLDMYKLDVHDFPSGRDIEFKKRKYKDPTIYHANYRAGVDAKVEFFKNLGLWYKN